MSLQVRVSPVGSMMFCSPMNGSMSARNRYSSAAQQLGGAMASRAQHQQHQAAAAGDAGWGCAPGDAAHGAEGGPRADWPLGRAGSASPAGKQLGSVAPKVRGLDAGCCSVMTMQQLFLALMCSLKS